LRPLAVDHPGRGGIAGLVATAVGVVESATAIARVVVAPIVMTRDGIPVVMARIGIALAGMARVGLATVGIALTRIALTDVARVGIALSGIARVGLARIDIATVGIALTGIARVALARIGIARIGVASVSATGDGISGVVIAGGRESWIVVAVTMPVVVALAIAVVVAVATDRAPGLGATGVRMDPTIRELAGVRAAPPGSDIAGPTGGETAGPAQRVPGIARVVGSLVRAIAGNGTGIGGLGGMLAAAPYVAALAGHSHLIVKAALDEARREAGIFTVRCRRVRIVTLLGVPRSPVPVRIGTTLGVAPCRVSAVRLGTPSSLGTATVIVGSITPVRHA
jgi:hypothetical protein